MASENGSDFESTSVSTDGILLMEYQNFTNESFLEVASTQPPWGMLAYGLELDLSVQIGLYSGIFLLAVLGNALVILTLVRNRAMRTITNLFLLNLAIADLLVGVLCMPVNLVGIILKDFVFGAFLCKLIPYLQAVSVSVSAWTLVAISVERYYAICHPFTSRRWQTLSHAYKIIALVWILSGISMLPIVIINTLQPIRNTGRHKCREEWPDWELERSYTVFLDVALLVLPLGIMSVKYSLITRTLWRGPTNNQSTHDQSYMLGASGREDSTSATTASNPKITVTMAEFANDDPPTPPPTSPFRSFRASFRPRSCTMDKQRKKSSEYLRNERLSLGPGQSVLRRSNFAKSLRRKKRVIQMLGVVVLEFFFCWTPLYVMNTWYLFSPSHLYHLIGPLGVSLIQLLAYLSSCVNPITYCFMNKGFRLAFKHAFCGCTLRNQSRSSHKSESLRLGRGKNHWNSSLKRSEEV